MQYNIHPIFVHFPIALLFIYSLIKIIPVEKWFSKFKWSDIRKIILLIGVAGAFIGLATGEVAEHIVRPNHQLVEAHSSFATAATWLYAILLLGEIASYINTHYPTWAEKNQTRKKILFFLETTLSKGFFPILLALLALIAIVITGILGGAMVYGTSADPFAGIILNLLGITL